ncbi:MAG: hypothetical protein R3C14_12870 [Caldilineaceae bacterium]
MTNNQTLSEAEIDDLIIAEADDDTAWEDPLQVHKAASSSLQIPAELAKRAAFLAGLHREKSMEAWLTRVIQERVELEESAFLQAKRELVLQSAASSGI